MLVNFVKEKVHPGIQKNDTIKTNEKNTEIHLQVNPIETGSIQEDDDVTDERGLVLNKTYNKEKFKDLNLRFEQNVWVVLCCKHSNVSCGKRRMLWIAWSKWRWQNYHNFYVNWSFPPSRGNAIVSGFDLKRS